jgi:hypothetical protein
MIGITASPLVQSLFSSLVEWSDEVAQDVALSTSRKAAAAACRVFSKGDAKACAIDPFSIVRHEMSAIIPN